MCVWHVCLVCVCERSCVGLKRADPVPGLMDAELLHEGGVNLNWD